MKFQKGSIVKLSKIGKDLYPPGPDQGNGGRGLVVWAGYREQDPKRPYLVVWFSNQEIANSYREEDLEPAESAYQIGGTTPYPKISSKFTIDYAE